MSDDAELLDAVDDLVDQSDTADSSSGDEKLAKMLAETRREAAKKRVQNRELTTKLEQQNADYQAALEELDKLRRDLEGTSSELEREREARQKLVEATDAANKTVIAGLPEKLRKIVPVDYDPLALRTWLDAAVPTLTQVTPPLEGEVGSRPDRTSDNLAIGEAEMQLATALGIDPQQLVKSLKK